MIEMRDVTKKYRTRHGLISVLDQINLTIKPGDKVGILGANGAGKSTLIRLLSGAEQPTTGVVQRGMTVSWPLAFTGGFQGSLTGLDNLRFICRVYGVDHGPLLPVVADFSELGKFFREPLKTYSSGMRARLAFALSMAIEFDCYLIDEVLAVGDTRFQEKCKRELFEKRKNRAIVIVSHMPDQIREHCTSVYVLKAGRALRFDDITTAYDFYTREVVNSALPPTAAPQEATID
jgi:capsular polysaccharide transport system ATP-binding protein